MNTRLIIDGSNALHRAYWQAENNKIDSSYNDIYDVGTIYIFLKSLKATVEKFPSDEVWITWDKKKKHPSTNFRKELAQNLYKKQRDPEKTLKVHEYHDRLSEWLDLLGVYQLYPYVLEADDVISWLTQTNKSAKNIIVSMDKDLLQLVSNNTSIYNPTKKIMTTPENFESITGVKIEHYVYYKALLGDTSDNVNGVYGYGKVKSKKLVGLGIEAIKSKLSQEEFELFNKNLQIMDLSDSFTKEIGEVECYIEQCEEISKKIKPNIRGFEIKCEENGLLQFSRKISEWRRIFDPLENTLVKLLSNL